MTTPDFLWQHVREDWEDPDHTIARHTNSGPFPWSNIDTFVIHYTAAPRIPDDTAGYLRAIQRDYITNRHGGPTWTGADGKTYDGYSIGYSAAVTQTGEDWELRGVRCQAAATSGWNSRSFACLVLVDGAEPCTPAAIAKVRELVAFVRRHSPKTVFIRGHRDCNPTACPGDGVYAQIESGAFEPRETTPPPPPAKEDMKRIIIDHGTVKAAFNEDGTILTAEQYSVLSARADVVIVPSKHPEFLAMACEVNGPAAAFELGKRAERFK